MNYVDQAADPQTIMRLSTRWFCDWHAIPGAEIIDVRPDGHVAIREIAIVNDKPERAGTIDIRRGESGRIFILAYEPSLRWAWAGWRVGQPEADLFEGDPGVIAYMLDPSSWRPPAPPSLLDRIIAALPWRQS